MPIFVHPVYPNIACYFVSVKGQHFSLSFELEIRGIIGSWLHRDKEIVVTTDYVLSCFKFSFNKAYLLIFLIILFNQSANKNPFEGRHCLLNHKALRCSIPSEQLDRNNTSAEVGFVLLVDYVDNEISTFDIMQGMDHQIFVNFSYPEMCGFICAIVVDSCPATNRPNIVELPVKATHIERFVKS